MLKVQEYLRGGKTLENLEKDFAIKVTRHPTKPLVLLNYDQLNSPKTHPIVMECRGLCLDTRIYEVVSRGFSRFFNLGEAQELQKDFNWEKFYTFEKVDGSYVGITGFEGEPLIHTRGSFAEGLCFHSEKSWKELILECLTEKQLEAVGKYDSYSFVFEYVGPHNQVVKYYPEPKLVLLSVYNRRWDNEVFLEAVDSFAEMYGFRRPERYEYNSPGAILDALDKLYVAQSTDEGFVLIDDKFNRIKVKNKYYLSLHQLGNNGNIASYKVLLPLVLVGEQDEVVAYWPHLAERVDEIKKRLKEAYNEAYEAWFMTLKIVERKKFAQQAIKRTPRFSGLLFKLKDQHGTESNEEHLQELWRKSEQLLYKALFEKKEDKTESKG